MNVGVVSVIDRRARAPEPTDDTRDGRLVPRDRRRTDEHRVAGVEFHESMPPGRDEGQCGERFTLAPGGDHHLTLRREVDELPDVDHSVFRDVEETEFTGDATDTVHRPADERYHPPRRNRRVGDLLHPVDVRCKTRGDDPSRRVLHDLRNWDLQRDLRRNEAGLFCVRAVRHEQSNSVPAERREHRQVGWSPIDRSRVQLEVSRVDHQPFGGVERDTRTLWDAVRYGYEHETKRPLMDPLVVDDDPEVSLDAEFLDPRPGQRDGESGSEHGDIHVTKELAECTDVVLMPMRENDAHHIIPAVDHPLPIRIDQVDSNHVLVREHEPAVDHGQLPILLEHRAVATDLAQPSEKCDGDAHRSCAIPSARSIASTVAADAGSNGSRGVPTGPHSRFIAALTGMGFGSAKHA